MTLYRFLDVSNCCLPRTRTRAFSPQFQWEASRPRNDDTANDNDNDNDNHTRTMNINYRFISYVPSIMQIANNKIN